jgi:hypothetical protein
MAHVILLIFLSTITSTITTATTKITRRRSMLKNTRCILGNPSQQGKKTQPNPFLYSSRERPPTPSPKN